MIISSPLLFSPEEFSRYGTDDARLEAAMPPTASRLVGGTGAAEGTFPVSNHLMWHNGVHLQAQDKSDHVLPLRAIADGEIIFLNRPTPDSSDLQHGQNYDEGWTDNGCIILKHNTEIGANGDQPVTVTYYSLYMHIEKFMGGLAEGKKVYRKDVLGGAGRIYGHKKQVHFEICCDQDNLAKLIGRAPAWQDSQQPAAKDGRTDSVFGSLYVYLPASTPISNTAPTDHLRHDTGSTLGTAQWIELDYGDDGATPGSCALTSYGNKGDYGNTRKDHDAEYNLYKEATERHNMVVKAHPAARSSPSGWYELLRFGRNLGRSNTDKDPLPDNAAHWRKIKTIIGREVWADLNAPGTCKFSDADFLPQFGWNCYDDDSNPHDQRCDSPKLKALIRAQDDQPDPDRNKDDVKLSKRLGDKDVTLALRRTICKFPSEWDRNTISQRYQWLNEMEYGFKDHPEDWTRFENHLKAITFEKLPQAYLDAQWHFHPTEFIKLFRKCGWLDKQTLARIYKETPESIREKYRPALNGVMRKYLINTAVRQAHFLGQGAVESSHLSLMLEGSVSFSKNPNHPSFLSESAGYYSDPKDTYGYFHNYEKVGNDLGNIEKSDLRNFSNLSLAVQIDRDIKNRPTLTFPSKEQISAQFSKTGDGMKFRGRGFKQLTGRANYAAYWEYRGWISVKDFDKGWWKTGTNVRPPAIDKPQIISTVPYNCIDSGGQFAAKNGIPKAADKGVNTEASSAVSSIVNKWDAQSFNRRFSETKNSYLILGDTTS